MPKAPAETVDFIFTIHKGLPFRETLQYVSESGAPIDLTGYVARMVLRSSLLSEEELFVFSDSPGAGEGRIELGDGSIDITDMTPAMTAAIEWDQAVAHLVVGQDWDDVTVYALIRFDAQPCTTGVPA